MIARVTCMLLGHRPAPNVGGLTSVLATGAAVTRGRIYSGRRCVRCARVVPFEHGGTGWAR